MANLSETKDLLYIAASGYWQCVFEIIRHRMDRETAGNYVTQLERYHAAGFEALFFPENKLIRR